MIDYFKLFNTCWAVKREADGAWYPVRFSDEMLDFYGRLSEMTKIRSRSTAGITLNFTTDAESIAFDYRTGEFCRPFVAFDVFENDAFVTTIHEPDRSPSGHIEYHRQASGRSRVTIALPYSTDVHLSNLQLGDAQPITDHRPRILFLGDSITQGMTTSRPSQGFAAIMSRTLDQRALNQGVGGYVFDPKSLGDVEACHADRIVVAYGTNDYTALCDGKNDLARWTETVRAFMRELHRESSGVPVHVITPLWRIAMCETPDERLMMAKVRETIAMEADACRFDVLDGASLIGHDSSFFFDGLHPNDLGANMVAANIIRHLLARNEI